MENVSTPALPTASEVARAIRTGQRSATELVEVQLSRIEKFNPALNAIVTLDGDNARCRAREADRAIAAGKPWGPLHGVPITVKDSFDTARLRTTSGYRPFRGRVPVEDAAPVARLREAGAIILGKTNLPTFANGLQTDNALFGRTNNPWDPRRTPGGSSGGAAAAISAGLSFLEFGSDIGGSIRIPAHFCGVYGLKATAGRIAGKGHVHVASARRSPAPTGCEGLFELASFGPMARSIEDLELVLPIVSEPCTPPLTPSPRKALSELRVAWTDDFGGAPLDGGSRRLMQSFADSLSRHGCHVERCSGAVDFVEAWRISGICSAAVNTLFQPLPMRWVRRAVSPLLRRFGPQHPLVLGLFEGLALDQACLRRALEQRIRIIETLEQFLGKWDCWICPVFPTPAFTHRSARAPIDVDNHSISQLEANLYAIIFNITGHPVVTMPIGLSPEGLPIGVQVIGSRWQEMALLNATHEIASVTAGCQRPQGY